MLGYYCAPYAGPIARRAIVPFPLSNSPRLSATSLHFPFVHGRLIAFRIFNFSSAAFTRKVLVELQMGAQHAQVFFSLRTFLEFSVRALLPALNFLEDLGRYRDRRVFREVTLPSSISGI